MTARIVLLRHAEPARSARGRAIGRSDVGLSREGARHARELATNLGSTGVARIVSSPAVRALRTAEPIARAIGVAIEVDADLREIDFGVFDGRTFASIQRGHPELYATWMRAPTGVAFPGGETWSALRWRARSALDRIGEAGAARTTVAVTHLGVILAVLGTILAIPDDDVFDLTIGHGSITTIERSNGPWLVRSLAASTA